MKIKFLGTSHGVPMPGRHYQSMLLITEKGDYLVDAGAPVMDILINEGYDLTRLKAVFVTHLHQDHIAGLPDMIGLASWYYKEMKYIVYLPQQRGIDAIKAFCNALYEGVTERVSFGLIETGNFFDDGNVKITAVLTEHIETEENASYGFWVETENGKLYITGDMHWSLKDFPTALLSEPVDMLVTECAHFSAEALVERLKMTEAKRIGVVHVYPTDKYEKLRAYAKEAKDEMIFPEDGDEFEIFSS